MGLEGLGISLEFAVCDLELEFADFFSQLFEFLSGHYPFPGPFDTLQFAANLMRTMKKLIVSMTLALVAAVAIAADTFPEISTTQLRQAIRHKTVILIDVNGTESWQKAHIPGALDFIAIEGNLQAKLPADKNALIVAYCGNEQCPAYRAAATAAQKLGYTNVKHYAKGIQGWVKLGLPTEKSNN